ncbi:hypothetical protein SAMN05192561_10332 [Halopenitus malekzadehii]|uniref:Uncharacterized protein n=1 Tax=Halopenitus malekzadehii TaxID=1267564 RepID=A0A1H6IR60_9EURY|nr:hypothetical protein [Halopenitus malekzadehii]SEH49112.1 hypothetical protein SAMN05192561_10332 [Halopenitus malekzadehii]
MRAHVHRVIALALPVLLLARVVSAPVMAGADLTAQQAVPTAIEAPATVTSGEPATVTSEAPATTTADTSSAAIDEAPSAATTDAIRVRNALRRVDRVR